MTAKRVVQAVPRNGVVAVTGAAGYVGSWICNALSSAGYNVRALVRDSKSDKNAHLVGIEGVTLMEADMLKDGAYDEAFNGADAIVHSAAIVDLQDNTEEGVVTPTVEGSRNMIASAKKSATVKHVIGTSSIAAVTNFAKSDEDIHTEEDHVDLDHPSNQNVYAKAKLLEERLLWEYQDETGIPVTTINPGMIWGPCIAKRHTKASPLYIRDSLYGNAVPPIATRIVDVRDVALAHVKALQTPEAHGNRFLVINDINAFQLTSLGSKLQTLFPQYKMASPPQISPVALSAMQLGLKVPGVSQLLTKATGVDEAAIAMCTRCPQYANSKAKEILGIEYRPLEDTLKETVDSMVSQGFIKPTPAA